MTFAGGRNGVIPPQVEHLAPCEKELATLIYVYGPMTAKDIEGRHLTRKLSNSAVRSMLGRLCNKSILKRHKITGSHISTDRRIPYVYAPAITSEALRVRALAEVARDYFGGSLPRMAEELAGLCAAQNQMNKVEGSSSRPRGTRIAA
mgnify:CR=1 FL=1